MNYLHIKSSLLLVLIFFVIVINAQDVNKQSFKEIEKSLNTLVKKIAIEKSFATKEETNNQLVEYFRSALEKKGSIDYPFDSLKNIGKLVSKDRNVRIFTWDISQVGGNYKYYGFIQVRKDKKNTLVFELNDCRNSVKDQVNEILGVQSWIGALYYSIIEEEFKGKKNYILLGFDFNNAFSSKKIIEVLTFDDNYNPIFGSKLFKVGDINLSRVIFEFSARATLMLRYIADSKIIVFDHLSPSRPDFEGNYQFYGPDFSYDGFRFEKGEWVYTPDLDLRNPSRDRPKPIDTIQKLPEPGFLYKSKGGIPMQIVK
ncbi:MAG: hypothetical protein AB9846_15130 [Tenuifilaceae bacterium]